MLDKNDVYDILKKQYHDHKLSHAFLLETNNQDECLTKILKFLKLLNCENSYQENCTSCNLCHLILTRQLPNLLIIKPDGAFIRKEQILELKNAFKTKPLFSKYNMYIIMNAERLNSSSANTMLKFLEEPEEKIIGFFITDNKERVIETIKSRCQILLDYYNNSKIDDNDIVLEAIKYIKQLESAKLEALFYNKNEILPKIIDKSWLVNLFLKMLNIYETMYEKKINSEKISKEYEAIEFVLDNNDKAYFLQKINLLKNLLTTLDFNVNNQLVLDRLVLESW